MALMMMDAPVADDLLNLEDLDLAALCQCSCGPGDHDPDAGCQSCACGARGLRGLAGKDQDEDDLDVVVQRILVALKIARKRRIKLGEDRAARDGRDATRPKVAPRVTTTKPKATTRAVAPRSRTISTQGRRASRGRLIARAAGRALARRMAGRNLGVVGSSGRRGVKTKPPATRKAGVVLPPRRPAPVHASLRRLKSTRSTHGASQNTRRAYRKQLGLCSDCTERVLQNLSRCARHHEAHLEYVQKSRDRKARKRGWKLQRVKY
jgi:pyruvate/2-oxoglutarate dehydrogenase complex dihydrolipoamide acyltransferase (E2) component